MTTIRVTPSGREPIELPAETAAVGASKPFSSHGQLEGAPSTVAILKFADGSLEERAVSMLSYVCGEYENAYVRIGDAWPLCTVEPWRQRADRLERELAAVRRERAIACGVLPSKRGERIGPLPRKRLIKPVAE